MKMSNILSQVSGFILAGTNLEDQQMFDGIRNLSNMSLISYPKSRLLQIILDPRIISQDANTFNKCQNFMFGEIRVQLLEDLSKKLIDKEMIIMLKSFTNQLLDNDEMIHTKVGIESDSKKKSKIQLLYKKCQDLGLQYGFLNLFPAKTLLKISRSKYKIVDQIIKQVHDPEEFKDILHIFAIDYNEGVDLVRIAMHLSKTTRPVFQYLMSLPKEIIGVLIDYISMTNKNLIYERIEDLVEIYNKRQDLFLSVKKKPLLAKLFMLHDRLELMNDFLDMIASNNRKISEIAAFNNSISAFIFSQINYRSSKKDVQALMEFCVNDMKRCKLIMSNAHIINELGLSICFLCDFASNYSEVFDLIFDKESENLDIIYNVKKNKKISAEAVMKEVASLTSLKKTREFFLKMHSEYDE